MSKNFKEWNKQFSPVEIEECRRRWLYNGSTSSDRNSYTQWSHIVKDWPQEFVQQCVYHLSDSEEWQRFRVAMKGLTTSEKLYMLDNRYVSRVLSNVSADPTGEQWVKYKIEKCRIDNYIGALVRGGQLSSDGKYTILK